MACRDIQRAVDAAEEIKKSCKSSRNCGELVIKELDLSSFASVRKCAADILSNENAIHLLVNNAGIN